MSKEVEANHRDSERQNVDHVKSNPSVLPFTSEAHDGVCTGKVVTGEPIHAGNAQAFSYAIIGRNQRFVLVCVDPFLWRRAQHRAPCMR